MWGKSKSKVTNFFRAFFDKSGLAGAIGAVDGCHIPCNQVSETPEGVIEGMNEGEPYPQLDGAARRKLYRNRKGTFSHNMMAICDHRKIIRYFTCRHPGLTTDTIFSSAFMVLKVLLMYLEGKANTVCIGAILLLFFLFFPLIKKKQVKRGFTNYQPKKLLKNKLNEVLQTTCHEVWIF